MTSIAPVAPPDRKQREDALNPTRSILVRAPAGSGKTDLLTRRFLRLLARVEDPGQVVAITFTRAAAAEMRHRIVAELQKAWERETATNDEFSMEALAARVLERSRTLGWNLLDLPSQLRISTIDSFCRELALRQPLLSGFGGSLEVAEDPADLYRRAARLTLNRLGDENPSPRTAELQHAIERLLLWRDNNWHDLEGQLVEMLKRRDQWMHGFVLNQDPDWDALREELEQPFARAVREGVTRVAQLLADMPEACEEAHELARFACEQKGLHRDLAELAEFPCGAFSNPEDLDEARRAYLCLADLLLTKEGAFRARITASEGFPAAQRVENARMKALIEDLRSVPGLSDALHALRGLPPARYSDAEWEIVRACFTILRQAAAELKVLFAEAGRVDFIEVAQLARLALGDAEGSATDAAIAEADTMRHLLIDEFQDTNRRQWEMVASLMAARSDAEERSLFLVGDPMQSIYSFRDADVELMLRVQRRGLEFAGGGAMTLDPVALSANFRTAPELIGRLNDTFEQVFANDDGSGIGFSGASAVREPALVPGERMHVHLEFMPQTVRNGSADAETQQRRAECKEARKSAHLAQINEIVELIRKRCEAIERERARGAKYRIAVLGRTRKALAPIAAALRDAEIPFRAVGLEDLGERPEVLDALALARAFLMPEDRVAWLGVLRAPWCGLALDDLHRLTSGDDAAVLRRTIPDLLAERRELLSASGGRAVDRLLGAWNEFPALRAAHGTATVGTRMEQVWLRLGGDACVDATGRANVQLLWSRMDRLPSGEAGVLNGELGASIEGLMAEPDPRAESDYGVQLMTVHKSKGLEFEVVIVPELQQRGRRGTLRMLSWMERGLTSDGEHGATEFLVAPLKPKGDGRSSTKDWVDAALRRRETQEMRRILYVAATRAREELHLFARPEYRNDKKSGMTLCEPAESLMRTAWPALEEKVRARFAEWKERRTEGGVSTLAAQAQLLQMPATRKPAILRRLPENFELPPMHAAQGASRGEAGVSGTLSYRRHEGGMLSRALGRAVHLLLEEAARLLARMDGDAARAAIKGMRQRALAEARGGGVDPAHAQKLADDAVAIASRTLQDATGQWILTTHADAASETSWSGVLNGSMRTVRADRVFRAGEPGSATGTTWWVIDYKTAHPEGSDVAALLRELRPAFAPQLAIYAKFLRKLHGEDIDVRAGLYYPRLLAFDWWQA
ncbi:MAG: UvrD-helicase domain-containing protein [Acidobacteriota bacterium]